MRAAVALLLVLPTVSHNATDHVSRNLAWCQPSWGHEYCKGDFLDLSVPCSECGCDACLGEASCCGDVCLGQQHIRCAKFQHCPAGCKAVSGCPTGCYACPAGEFNEGPTTSTWCQSCDTYRQQSCPAGAVLIGCGGTSRGECKVVPCPDGSEGQSVGSGCQCRDGYVGSIVSSDVAPYYAGKCYPLCPECEVSASDGTPLYKVELPHGVNVLTGARSPRAVMTPDAYRLTPRTQSSTQSLVAASRDYSEVNSVISNEYGWEASVALSGSVPTKIGAVSASLTSTFSGSEASKVAQSAIRSSSKYFSWTVRKHFIYEASLYKWDELSDDFKSSVQGLSADGDYASFKLFFERFGTHLVLQADVGVRSENFMSVSSSFKQLVSEQFLQECFSWAVGAGVGLERAFSLGASASYGEQTCDEQSTSETTSSFLQNVEIQQRAYGGETEFLSCDEPPVRFQNYVADTCLNEMNAEVFAKELTPVWALFPDAVPGINASVASAAEFYFLKYITEEGTLIDGTRNPDRLPESFADFLANGKIEENTTSPENGEIEETTKSLEEAGCVGVGPLFPLFAAALHAGARWL